MFILSAFLKAWSPGPAQRAALHVLTGVMGADSLESLVYEAARATPAILVVLEIAIGCALLTAWRPRLVLRITVGVLSAFSAALVALLADSSAPTCGCTGAVRLAESARAENLLGLGRNAILIAACLWALPRAPRP
ncbi:MAG: hypothetical protein D6693_05060 [Planctomycetota bacterium]|nr:MAG: hypothetical protein D6693_05060 [Planctomycetota bacterium]